MAASDPTMIQLSTEVELKELVVAMCEASQGELFALIVALDESQCDWSFTIRLADHFDKQREAFNKEAAEESHDAE